MRIFGRVFKMVIGLKLGVKNQSQLCKTVCLNLEFKYLI